MPDNKKDSFGGPICRYCGEPSELLESSEVYSDGGDRGFLWVCRDDDAWVGCHKGGTGKEPLGTLANAQLRAARRHVHAVFDPLWRIKMKRDQCTKHEARGAAYKWLREQMDISVDLCHVAMFDLDDCRQAIRICRSIGKK